jgi:hypothetical protein
MGVRPVVGFEMPGEVHCIVEYAQDENSISRQLTINEEMSGSRHAVSWPNRGATGVSQMVDSNVRAQFGSLAASARRSPLGEPFERGLEQPLV